MIRVLHILHSMNRGGIETFIMNLYRNMSREQVQFDFLLHVNAKCAFDDEIIKMGGKIYHIPGRRRGLIQNREALNSFFTKNPEYKIVHQHVSSLSYIEPLKIAGRHNVPVRIIHSHNTREGGGGGKGTFKSKLHEYLHLWHQRNIEQYATDFFACSEPAALWLYGKERFNRKQYIIIKNGIDTRAFAYSEQGREKIRVEFGIHDKKVIGHVGRFAFQKNHTFLIDIFKEINKKDPDTILMLAGDGDLRRQIHDKVNFLGLQDKVIFTGIRTDTPDLYCAMDAFLFPSIHEGFPVVLVEAQASGLPCTVSKNVAQEAGLRNDCIFLSLESAVEEWAAACLEAVNIERGIDSAPSLEEYDIKIVAGELEKFYLLKG